MKIPNQIQDCHLMHKIFENQNYCVSAFDKDKIFIHPQSIISTDRGLFIDLNGNEFYPLPLLQFNKNGHFIQSNLMHETKLASTKEQTKGPCPNCDVNTGKYGHCKNIQCLFYGVRVL